MKTVINENQKGFHFKNGKYVGVLDAGKYRTFGQNVIETFYLDDPVSSMRCSLETLLSDPAVASRTASVEVGDEQLALHYVNGIFSGVLPRGKHAYWTVTDRHEFTLVDISDPRVDPSVPKHVFGSLSHMYYIKIEAAEYQKARLFFDGRLVDVLDAGTYYFWKNSTKVTVDYVDTRLTRMDVSGQELLTADKVTIRINLVCNYRITDCVKILTEIDDPAEQLHLAAQLALREYVGKYKLDEILENKDAISAFVLGRLREKQQELYLEVSDAGVKDIILPGEIRDIMNTVLVAEKRAQANVITRREEVASTRSLLNTAKLMDENKTLYKLKELEYVERICENVGNVTVTGGGDLLTTLAGLIRPAHEQ